MENEEFKKEQRRALNIIWTAADDYSFRPEFMSFDRNGRAVLYLNMIIGCTRKWFGSDLVAEKAADFEGAVRRELYDTILWLCLESCIYKKELPLRPAMKGLREEYAGEFLEGEEKILEPSLTLTLQSGHFGQVLGKAKSVTPWEKRLLHAVDLDGDLTGEQVKAAVDRILWEFFKFRAAPGRQKPEKTVWIPGLSLLRKLHLIPTMVIRAEDTDYGDMTDSGPDEKENAGRSQKDRDSRSFLMDVSASGRGERDRRYLRICFGQSMYGEQENRRLERELCTGSHQNCHLYFTGDREKENGRDVCGDTAKEKAELPEAYRQLKKFKEQEEKNRAYFDEHREMFRNCILRLRDRLLAAALRGEEPETVSGMAGNLNGAQVWRGLYLDDNRIFFQNRLEEREPFSVDIMLDGSASQLERQEVITSQACVIAESLRLCKIPAQVYSFCSLYGYTVFRIFRTYGQEGGNRNIFRYAAAGWNRDGLALRGAGHLMEQSPCKKRVLLILTDASPNDDKRLSAGGRSPVGKEYAKTAGIRDAAEEVRKLKKKGTRVIGLFCGQDSDLDGAGKIYGSSFARITDMAQLADTVGGLILREVLREE